MELIGRKNEILDLERSMISDQSEFIVLYGRRRVGKTYLIRQLFENKFSFYVSGLSKAKIKVQLANFNSKILQNEYYDHNIADADDWMAAFNNLITVLEANKNDKKIVFIDELPWLDTKNSGIITALEYFWNSWASARNDIKLIVCGSAAWWMLEKLIKNKQGLYNRVTNRIKLKPFTLKETNEFLIKKGGNFDHYQVVQIYMAMGGIPFYLNQIIPTESAAQNINRLFFGSNAKLGDEYSQLFASLFNDHERHLKVIEALAKKKKGLQREEILKITKLKDGGSISKIFAELEASDFLRKYSMPGQKVRNAIYQLTDNFTLFYHSFMSPGNKLEDQTWIELINTPNYYSWAGNAFEIVCLQHSLEIKKALGIIGIQSSTYAWSNKNTQIDMVLERKDNVVNLFEFKFSVDKFSITKEYAQNLANKISEYNENVNSRKAIWLILITTYGLKEVNNAGMVHQSLDMTIFFE